MANRIFPIVITERNDTMRMEENIISNITMVREVALKPTYKQKSYYGKAHIFEDAGKIYLRSYKTIVAVIDNSGKFHRLWGGYSTTTQYHINSFRETYGMNRISKSEWVAMPVEWRYAIV